MPGCFTWCCPCLLPKCEENPALVMITMETCPVSTLLPWESTSTPQMYIFHQHTVESCSLWANDVPSPLPSSPGPWEQGTAPHPAGTRTGMTGDDRRWQGGHHHSEIEIVWVKSPSLGMCLGLRACKKLLGSGAYRNNLLAQMFVRPTNLQRSRERGKNQKPTNRG